MLIFGIGLNKTGTTSLAAALGILGLPCLHHPGRGRMGAILEGRGLPAPYAACCDYPVWEHWRELDALYPGAKFILTTRDVRSWVDSRLLHVYANRVLGLEPEWTEIDTAADAALYDEHHAAVRGHFADRPGDFLELPLGAGWGPLCEFLGRPIPCVPYPRQNTSDDFLREISRGRTRRHRRRPR